MPQGEGTCELRDRSQREKKYTEKVRDASHQMHACGKGKSRNQNQRKAKKREQMQAHVPMGASGIHVREPWCGEDRGEQRRHCDPCRAGPGNGARHSFSPPLRRLDKCADLRTGHPIQRRSKSEGWVVGMLSYQAPCLSHMKAMPVCHSPISPDASPGHTDTSIPGASTGTRASAPH